VATLQIIQRRSAAGTNQSQRATLRTLGLRRIGSTVERTETPAVMGMVRAVAHLIDVNRAPTGKDAAEQGSDG
jgi:large subunit ribosomal protein L30